MNSPRSRWRPITGRAPHRSPPLLLAPTLGVWLVCAACVPGDTEAVRAEIEAVTRRWERSLVAGDPASAVAEVFTEDAIRLPAGQPAVRGQRAIADALAGSAPLAEARFDIEELEAEGDLAFARGTYAVRAPDGRVFTGKFLEVWRRTRDGWRIHRVMWD